MAKYYHAHAVDLEKCNGFMTCMRHCPTQAIRVRDGKSEIREELCVDCGSCLSVCRSKAVVLDSEPITPITQFKYKVVVPTPSLYSQFDPSIHPYIIHMALKEDDGVRTQSIGAGLYRKLMIFPKKNTEKKKPS